MSGPPFLRQGTSEIVPRNPRGGPRVDGDGAQTGPVNGRGTGRTEALSSACPLGAGGEATARRPARLRDARRLAALAGGRRGAADGRGRRLAGAARAARAPRTPGRPVAVLRGRLSFVGPRALPPGTGAGHTGPRRLMTPGLTGPAQRGCRGGGSDTDLDDAYVERWTLWTDARLLAGRCPKLHHSVSKSSS